MIDLILLQIHPRDMILVGVAALVLLTWLFWPKRGLMALLSKLRMSNRRVMLEDALKHLYDCEYRNAQCNLQSVAGNLNISTDKAGKLIEHLLSMGLIRMDNQSVVLTDTGRSYSLRVIRVHRIWERYLADETGVPQADWHNEADRIEHIATPENTEKIAAQMGNPVFDPHGDPIPTAGGEMPGPKGKSLGELKAGENGVIIHIEDEPRNIYEQLVVQGLYPGMEIHLTHRDDTKISFVANGEEYTLTPLFATHITIELQAGKAAEQEKFNLLSSLDVGQEAEVAGISPNCTGQQRRRLMDMGIVPGSIISAQMKSASGDPVGYRVMGTTIGIRRKQADMIFIHPKKEKAYA